MYILSVFSPSRFLRCDLGVSSSGLHAQKALASTSYLIMCVNAMIVIGWRNLLFYSVRWPEMSVYRDNLKRWAFNEFSS